MVCKPLEIHAAWYGLTRISLVQRTGFCGARSAADEEQRCRCKGLIGMFDQPAAQGLVTAFYPGVFDTTLMEPLLCNGRSQSTPKAIQRTRWMGFGKIRPDGDSLCLNISLNKLMAKLDSGCLAMLLVASADLFAL